MVSVTATQVCCCSKEVAVWTICTQTSMASINKTLFTMAPQWMQHLGNREMTKSAKCVDDLVVYIDYSRESSEK